MKIHSGKGRNLLPFNFSKESYLNFNMPPLHIMKIKLIKKIAEHLVEKEKKEYTRKTFQTSKFKFQNVSATVGNFRNAEEEKCHIPLSVFI